MAGAFAFAESSPTLNLVRSASDIPNYDNSDDNRGVPPPVAPGIQAETTPAPATAAVTKSSAPAVTPPPPPAPEKKPNLLQRMASDVSENKVDYMVAGLAGVLTGYFLAGFVLGPTAFLVGAALVGFILLFRSVK